jgi:raffinose/stachyose/melibiose transport system permease protein
VHAGTAQAAAEEELLRKKNGNTAVFWLFLAPVLFAFVMVIVIPFVLGVYYSFTTWSSSPGAGNGIQFVGLVNYEKSLKDLTFGYSFLITIAYTIVNMAVINVVAFALALLVTTKIRLRNVYRAGFFVPNLIGGLILGYIWQFIFNNGVPALGVALGLKSWANPANLVLASNVKAICAIVAAGSWQYAGYIMMIYVAAIENVPQELHEAAQIDGASPLRRLIVITIPMAAQAFTITIFLTLVQSFKQFDVNFSLTGGGPSTIFMGKPIFGTELLALNIYDTAFVSNNLAMGQARAVIFFLVLAVVALVQVSFNKKREIEL